MTTIRLTQGDIAAVAADAVVNAANDHLWMGSGVAGALKRAGGDEIEREAMSQGPIPVGAAIVTGAGRLRARYVIHAAAMGQDLLTDARKIREATDSAMQRAEELGLASIAFPALGTGVGGFPIEACARVMLDAVHARLDRGSAITDVIFVLRSPDALSTFEAVLGGTEQGVG